MPNIMNRRKKKNKVSEIIVNDKSDSESSCSYDFSSSLNRKYNVLPEDLVKSKSEPLLNDVKGDVKDDCKLIRFKLFLSIY